MRQVLAVCIGGGIVALGLFDWLAHRNSKHLDAGGQVLFWRLYIGALVLLAGWWA